MMTGIFKLITAGCMLATAGYFNDGQNIGKGLSRNYETSGIVYSQAEKCLYIVSDSGIVSRMDVDGNNIKHWKVKGDLEDCCLAAGRKGMVYVAKERPDEILEFDTAAGQVRRRFNLSGFLGETGNDGIEAITYVPDANIPSEGYFYVGLQATGCIYVFHIPLDVNEPQGKIKLIRTFMPVARLKDISGMCYEPNEKVIYAIYDGGDWMIKMTSEGKLLEQAGLPGKDQEGIAVTGQYVFIAQDRGGVIRYRRSK